MKTVTAHELRRMILDAEELALLDAREEGTFHDSHIFYASCCALSRLERLAPRLVPRRSARVVVCDAGAGEAERAACRLLKHGYSDVSVLEGGIDAWAAAGYTLVSGVNVPSKAFGEVVEHELGTPSVSAEELQSMLAAGDDIVILDSRPTPEFTNFCIPGGVCCPGAELAYRVHDAAPSPDTTVVVNCAGRNLADRPHERLLVVTADDEALARLAAADLLVGELDAPVRYLEGGNGGWTAAGHSMTAANPVFLDDPDDVRVRVNEAEGGMEKAMNDYPTWEIGLVGDVARDGTAAWLRMDAGS